MEALAEGWEVQQKYGGTATERVAGVWNAWCCCEGARGLLLYCSMGTLPAPAIVL